MKTILLKLAGPLQSWGTSSHFETRHTDFYPSKSAVIGLIAASLGYRRDEDEKLQRLNELDFAVRVDQQGKLLRDYQIAKGYNKKGQDHTYITNRYYLEDAVFIIAISHKDDVLMSTIEEGLKNPYFQPFMGRRSLPLNADFLLKITSDSALDSLKQVEWQASEWFMKKHSGESDFSLEIYADNYLLEKEAHQLRQDRVISFSQKARKFGFRYETRDSVTVLNPMAKENETEHDVFGSIGDG
ncbi:type I-E CRISPR-associated protein Cas5/CasD [Streptococcus chenjunshii]|uniref:Type I-E CRISPR-associated protein Cas5/CasD n=1 Tax=Streptococcus chenjunshii TaxID=2173853 RepID=A0A372KPR7_9STRE|nr:type I-E CRISPR-associated protein Cas5/CasD [Streptococcus chenjunshii]AXQ78446.1 type I-E CRISPR-associated protein Cas5/CasD [Streptococcus chenjunshii]RFU52093.1 type I-E CRISPR-associated protein Cas5/CasD [Streptococcus chenjunshii]RFU54285.1 type I-E CRISPR-associated protein Cas5/CasD [Streptococcus chenjunshii]